jgi:hypothetical protein
MPPCLYPDAAADFVQDARHFGSIHWSEAGASVGIETNGSACPEVLLEDGEHERE